MFILGGGPSFKLVDWTRLTKSRVIAVNQAFTLAQWDAMFFADRTFWENRKTQLRDFAGLKVTTLKPIRGTPGIAVMRRTNNWGMTRNRHELSWNLSSGATAISLAAHLGAKRIVLLGFDMRWVDTCAKCHFPKSSAPSIPCQHCAHKGDHGMERNFHRDYVEQDPRKYNPYRKFMRSFPAIARDATQRGIEIINATPGSAIGQFPIVDPAEVIP